MLPSVLMLLGYAASPVGAGTFQVAWAVGVNIHVGVGV